MSDDHLTVELQKFIARHVESVEKLEILLLLSNHADKPWSVQEVFQQIQSSYKSVHQKLKDLVAEGLAERDSTDCFRFAPKSAELRDQVTALNATYQQRRFKVIAAIFSEKTDELRNFSDAFRLRKEKE